MSAFQSQCRALVPKVEATGVPRYKYHIQLVNWVELDVSGLPTSLFIRCNFLLNLIFTPNSLKALYYKLLATSEREKLAWIDKTVSNFQTNLAKSCRFDFDGKILISGKAWWETVDFVI